MSTRYRYIPVEAAKTGEPYTPDAVAKGKRSGLLG
jgi:hypothetical protein